MNAYLFRARVASWAGLVLASIALSGALAWAQDTSILPWPEPTPPIYGVRLIPHPASSATGGWAVRAEVDLPSSGWSAAWSDAHRDGNVFRASVRPIPPPTNLADLPVITTVRHTFLLGPLEPGLYRFVLGSNSKVLKSVEFVVGPPVSVAHLHVAQGNASWFADLALAIWRPGFTVLDWGEARRDGNAFFLEPLLGHLPTIDEADVLSANTFAPRLPTTGPVAIERHQYGLGILEPGAYEVVVVHADRKLAVRPFVVPVLPPLPGGPRAVAELNPLVEPVEEYRFSVTYSAPAGLDLASLRTAGLHVVPADVSPLARLLGLPVRLVDLVPLNSTGTHARGDYAVTGPGGSWDREDRGLWRVHIDRAAVRDLNGQTLDRDILGVFRVFALAPPPPLPGPRLAKLEVSVNDDGMVQVTGTLPDVPADYWGNVEWGEWIQRGSLFHVQVKLRRHDSPLTLPAFGAISHTWNLGAVQPGSYLLVLHSNLGHYGRASLHIPGEPLPPLTAWRERLIPILGVGPDGPLPPDVLASYAFGLDPMLNSVRPPAGLLQVDAANGLALTFVRAAFAEGVAWSVEATADFREWTTILNLPAPGMTVEDLGDGRERVTIALPATLTMPWRAFRLRIEVL